MSQHSQWSPFSRARKQRTDRNGVVQQSTSRRENTRTNNRNNRNSEKRQQQHENRTSSAAQAVVASKTPIVVFPPGTGHASITCQPGLERVLSSELTRLGIAHSPVRDSTRGRIALLPPITLDTILQCNLYLGSASKVQVHLIQDCSVRALGEVRRKVAKAVPWRQVVTVPWMQHQPQQHRQGWEGQQSNHDRDDNNTLYCKLKVTASKSRLLHTNAIRERILAGINDAMGTSARRVALWREDDDEDDEYHGGGGTRKRDGGASVLALEARVHYDALELWLDTNNTTPLHQRGYRLAVGKAPLREDLAYAMLYSAGWIPKKRFVVGTANRHDDQHDNDNDNKDDNEPQSTTTAAFGRRKKGVMLEPIPTKHFDGFLDPFCGSGTLPIEAACMRRGLAPGRFRSPPLAGTVWYNPKLWKQAVAKATVAVAPPPEKTTTTTTTTEESTTSTNSDTSAVVMIACSDRVAGAMEMTQENAKRAGVLDMLQIQTSPFSHHPWLSGNFPNDSIHNLLVATNPPYGIRVPNSGGSGGNNSPFSHLIHRLDSMGINKKSIDKKKKEKKKDDDDDENNKDNDGENEANNVQYTAAVLSENPTQFRRSSFGDALNNIQFSHGGRFVTSLVASNKKSKSKIAATT